jgi:hypothetical protein
MEWKVLSRIRGARPALDADEIGQAMWMIGILVIGLSLALQVNDQPAILQFVVQGSLVIYLIGLILIALGVFHVARTHFSARKAPFRARLRYARPAVIPLWYHIYGRPGLAARPWPRRWASLRFDHGQAWAWGVECLLVSGIIETALMLAGRHPLWHHVGMLILLVVVRTTLQKVREQVVRHGHGSASV